MLLPNGLSYLTSLFPSFFNASRRLLPNGNSRFAFLHKTEQGKVRPVFEEKEIACQEKYLLDEIARGSERFLRDFYKIFGGEAALFKLRIMDLSLPYERFLMNPKWFDINLPDIGGSKS